MSGTRRESYLQYARRLFLEGSRHRAPIEAVLAGERSIAEWCLCLNRARLLYGLALEPLDDEALEAFRQRSPWLN